MYARLAVVLGLLVLSACGGGGGGGDNLSGGSGGTGTGGTGGTGTGGTGGTGTGGSGASESADLMTTPFVAATTASTRSGVGVFSLVFIFFLAVELSRQT